MKIFLSNFLLSFVIIIVSCGTNSMNKPNFSKREISEFSDLESFIYDISKIEEYSLQSIKKILTVVSEDLYKYKSIEISKITKIGSKSFYFQINNECFEIYSFNNLDGYTWELDKNYIPDRDRWDGPIIGYKMNWFGIPIKARLGNKDCIKEILVELK